ncbi:ubiquitin-related domain-containing protein [Mycena rebaudengoi]|nr:ubiquitin-related domain-containing protein [Mycena rebaudengoi]
MDPVMPRRPSSSQLLPPQHSVYTTNSASTSLTHVMHEEDPPAPGAPLEPEEVVDPPVDPPLDTPVPQTPQTTLTFLLVSGRRRTMAFEPETTIGRVKELVWNAWPSDTEWQAERPPAPSYLRILYLGKILQDEDTLQKLNFPAHTPAPPHPATIVHLSIRAHAPPADDALKKKASKKGGRRRGTNASAAGEGATAGGAGAEEEDAGGCCCVIC